MTAQILDGNALGQKLRAGFKKRAEELAAHGVRPGLAVILVGEDPASQVYVRNKVNACAQAGFHSEKHAYPAEVDPNHWRHVAHWMNAGEAPRPYTADRHDAWLRRQEIGQ